MWEPSDASRFTKKAKDDPSLESLWCRTANVAKASGKPDGLCLRLANAAVAEEYNKRPHQYDEQED